MTEPAAVPQSEIVLDFADGEYTFRLGLAQLAELQQKCDAGVGLIFQRLMRGRYHAGDDVVFSPLEAQFKAEDIYETIRLGLIGGGGGVVTEQKVKVGAVEALQLVRRYVDGRPLVEGWRIAAAVIGTAVVGYLDPNAQPQKKSPQASQEAGTVKGGSTTT